MLIAIEVSNFKGFPYSDSDKKKIYLSEALDTNLKTSVGLAINAVSSSIFGRYTLLSFLDLQNIHSGINQCTEITYHFEFDSDVVVFDLRLTPNGDVSSEVLSINGEVVLQKISDFINYEGIFQADKDKSSCVIINIPGTENLKTDHSGSKISLINYVYNNSVFKDSKAGRLFQRFYQYIYHLSYVSKDEASFLRYGGTLSITDAGELISLNECMDELNNFLSLVCPFTGKLHFRSLWGESKFFIEGSEGRDVSVEFLGMDCLLHAIKLFSVIICSNEASVIYIDDFKKMTKTIDRSDFINLVKTYTSAQVIVS